MDTNLTIDSVVYTKVRDNDTGSVRRNTSVGLNAPKILTVSHQSTVDSKTKEPKVRSLVRFDISQPVGTPAIRSTDSMQVVLEIPESSTPTRVQEVIDAGLAFFGNTGLVTSILNQEI